MSEETTSLRSHHRRLPSGTGIVLLCAAVFFAVLELALRMGLFPGVSALVNASEAQQLEQLLEPDPLVLWRTTPNLALGDPDSPHRWLRTNRYGFRAPKISPEKPSGTIRVFCLGGSELFGATSFKGGFLKEEETYAGQLAADLNARGGGTWEVYNAGMVGQTSLQGLRLLQRDILPLHPDVVVVSYGWNEGAPAHDGKPDKDHRVLPRPLFKIGNFVAHHWYTWRVITALRSKRQDIVQTYRPERSTQGAPAKVQRVAPQDYAENLDALVSAATKAGVMVVVMTPPLGPLDGLAAQGADPEEFRRSYDFYTGIARQVAARWHIPFANADAWIGGKSEFFNEATSLDFIHFNAGGHARVAKELADIIWPRAALAESSPPS